MDPTTILLQGCRADHKNALFVYCHYFQNTKTNILTTSAK